ncbi:hypothetical protein [Streptomyces sp. BRA346]|uniref:hypothetical protein n=1 Tax=Streptomyces sp. BRA346 TaxID=2878199 RepID=UPI0040645168
MTDPNPRGLGRVFDEVPELYDRVRPGHPDELFADDRIAELCDPARYLGSAATMARGVARTDRPGARPER